MRRTLISLSAIVAGLVAVSIFSFLYYIDGVARTAIERGSTYALGVETTLDSARIGLVSGSFRLAGLEVANPPGFEDPRFLNLGEARLDLKTSSLREPTVIVPLFGIDGIEVDLDKQRGKANYDVILDNLARFESEEAEPEPAPEADAGPGKRFIIQEVVIRNVVAHVRVVERGGVPQVDVVVPEVRMRNLGGEGQPLTAAQVTNVLVKAVLASIAKAGANLFTGDGYGGLSETAFHYIGGIFKHARAINAFTNATTNSYKRLVPGFEAPVMLAYSARNRSASCRIPFDNNPKGRRIEVRFGDSAGNQYLAFAAMLMAGLDGIKNKIDPGSPMDKDLYDLPPEEEKLIPTVCSSLDQALEALDADREFLKAGGVFDDDLIDGYIDLKMEEVTKFRMSTHPVEFDMYYSL